MNDIVLDIFFSFVFMMCLCFRKKKKKCLLHVKKKNTNGKEGVSILCLFNLNVVSSPKLKPESDKRKRESEI